MISKILIANRGEIALRVIRTCKEIGIPTVAVYSTADVDSLHVRMADESVCIGGGRSKDSYLNMSNIISAADITGADAIHPGVGFLSENHVFAQMVEDHDLCFIGPTPEHVKVMADKISAKEVMKTLGVPLVPGTEAALESAEEAKVFAKKIGYPVLLKATCGGGGKGMQVVNSEADLEEAFYLATNEAQMNFGDSSVFMEKFIDKPRHIEVQILADQHGNVVHIGERDCSIQRRHQKIWEEAPSPALTPEERKSIGEISVQAMKKLGYRGVGTLEFLYKDGAFYFIEMNTRIQVEHTISEMIADIDIVKYQISVAQGHPLPFKQKDIVFRGHSIECRINAEHPETFVPSPGKINFYHPPGGKGVRVDSHIYDGYTIPPFYDSLISKLIVSGVTREECLSILKRALDEYVIDGVDTIIPLHKRLLEHPDVRKGNYNIKWLEERLSE